MNSPTVSVIMNCRNSAEYLRAAIESVFAQTFQDWEIIFFDNQSTDNSAEIAQSYGPKVRYFYSHQVLSLGEARNAAITHARGQYLCFLDCDDLWLPRKLEKQIRAFETSPVTARAVGLCYMASMRIDSQGHPLVSYNKDHKVYSGQIYYRLIDDCFMSCSSVMVTRKAFNEVGGFDDRWQQVEDWDLWLRIAKRYDAVYVSEELTQIRLHSTNQSGNIFAHFSEKMALIRQLKANDPSVAHQCRQVLAQLTVQKHIASLLLAGKQSLWTQLKLMLAVVGQTLLHPPAFMRTVRRYFNRDMYALFKYKFMQRT